MAELVNSQVSCELVDINAFWQKKSKVYANWHKFIITQHIFWNLSQVVSSLYFHYRMLNCINISFCMFLHKLISSTTMIFLQKCDDSVELYTTTDQFNVYMLVSSILPGTDSLVLSEWPEARTSSLIGGKLIVWIVLVTIIKFVWNIRYELATKGKFACK